MHCGCNLKGQTIPKLSVDENIRIAQRWGLDVIKEGNTYKLFYEGKIVDCASEETLDDVVYSVCNEIAFENTIKAFQGGTDNGNV